MIQQNRKSIRSAVITACNGLIVTFFVAFGKDEKSGTICFHSLINFSFSNRALK